MKLVCLRRAPVLVAVLVGAVALSGCAPAAHAPHGQPHHTASGGSSSGASTAPSPTPTPTPTPFPQSLGPLPANALFRITAKGVQANGATVDLVETVFAPAAPNPSDTALLNAQCNTSGDPTWQSSFSGPVLYVDATFDATLDPSSSATFDTKTQIASYLELEPSAFSGAYQTAQADCAPGFITVPGEQHAVGVVPASNPATSNLGWASPNVRYGFYGDLNDPSAADVAGPTVVKDCAVEISAAALATAPALAAWKTQPYVQSKSCSYTP